MVSSIGRGRALLVGAGLLILAGPGAARAQMPPEAAAIGSCLCMERDVATLSHEMQAKEGALRDVQQRLADLTAQLERNRGYDVNNPEAVARYKALLERHDAAYRQSIGPVVSEAREATARYNAEVNEYNAQCANHPFNSELMAEIRQTLTCPPPR
jgi:hypothetical protein